MSPDVAAALGGRIGRDEPEYPDHLSRIGSQLASLNDHLSMIRGGIDGANERRFGAVPSSGSEQSGKPHLHSGTLGEVDFQIERMREQLQALSASSAKACEL